MKLYSNEVVFRGHPDKCADQISDALLDAYLAQDANTRAGIETVGGKGKIFVTGEVTSSAKVDVEKVVKRVLTDVGYDADAYEVINNIGLQSADIAQGVDIGGAGDQGMMFGYACDETDKLVPKAMVILQDLSKAYDELRQRHPGDFYADGKAQITGYYTDDFRLEKIKTFTISYQNSEINREWTDTIIKGIALEICDKYGVEVEEFLINPTGKFFIGGFAGDSGLCLNEDTLIYTKKGLQKIKDVKVGTVVYTELGVANIVEKYNNGIKNTRIITDETGCQIEATLNHPFRVFDGKNIIWKECGSLSEGDILLKKKSRYLNKDGLKNRFVKYTKFDKDINISLDENFAYLVGWLIGDGNTTADDRITFYFGSEDEKNHIYNKLLSVFPKEEIKFYAYQNDRFYILSKKIVKVLENLGIYSLKGNSKEIPRFILESTDKMKQAFLCGLFDADGSISDECGRDGKYLTIVLTTSSIKLAQQVSILLQSMGMHSTIDYRKVYEKDHISSSNGSVIRGGLHSYDVRLTGLSSIRKFLNNVGFDLSYKQNKYRNKDYSSKWYINDTVNFYIPLLLRDLFDLNLMKANKYFENYANIAAIKTNRNYGIDKIDYILDMFAEYANTVEYKKIKYLYDNFEMVKVRDIKNSQSMTYDISLDDNTHSFIANGFVVHNTGRKIVVDSYQSFAPVGGGAFSGKDPTKVDRSAAYKARQLAIRALKDNGLKWCEVQLSYAIGVAQPLAIYVDSDKGNLEVPIEWYEECTPANIIKEFDLRTPIYEKTAQFGHFGNNFVWENV